MLTGTAALDYAHDHDPEDRLAVEEMEFFSQGLSWDAEALKGGIPFDYLGRLMTLRHVGTYRDGTPALEVHTETGERWARMTVHVPGTQLQLVDGEFLVKQWSENAGTYARLCELGILLPTDRAVPIGHVAAVVCHVQIPA